MSKRRDAKALARWEHDTHQWAIDTGRDLALDLYYDRDRAACRSPKYQRTSH